MSIARRRPYERVVQEICVEGYKLLSEKYINAYTKLTIQCPRGHLFKATRDKFVNQGCRCPECNGNQKWTIEEIRAKISTLAGTTGYELLSETYNNIKTKLKFRCPKRHIFESTWSNFRSRGCRCPICNESRGEKIIASILHDLQIEHKRGYKLNGTRLELDFYIPSLNVAIECDGDHHFRPVRFGGMTPQKASKALIKQRERDCRKDQLCQECGIKLVRVAWLEDSEEKDIIEKVKGSVL